MELFLSLHLDHLCYLRKKGILMLILGLVSQINGKICSAWILLCMNKACQSDNRA